MIHPKLLMAAAIISSGLITACSDTAAPRPVAQGDVSFARSGILHVEKDCTAYHGLADETCTITSSNVKGIELGTTIIYASDAVGASLNTDVALNPPGSGNNIAFGHCAISLAPVSIGTRVGGCTISGGTGKFTKLHATVDVTYMGGPNYAWDGPFSFSPRQ